MRRPLGWRDVTAALDKLTARNGYDREVRKAVGLTRVLDSSCQPLRMPEAARGVWPAYAPAGLRSTVAESAGWRTESPFISMKWQPP